MLERFTRTKTKTNKNVAAKEAETTSSSASVVADKPASQSQNLEGPQLVLSYRDEDFLRKQIENVDEPPIVILQGDSGTTTPRPNPLTTPATEAPPLGVEPKDTEAKGKGKPNWTSGIKNRFGTLKRTVSNAAERRKTKPKSPGPSKTEKGKEKENLKEGERKETRKEEREEIRREGREETRKQEERKSEERQAELTAALEGLSIAAENGRAFSITPATKELLDKFIQILKDISNGVPTAYQDLIKFFDSSSKTLEEIFTTLPSSLQKIIKTLPKKIQSNLAPELLRAAAAASPAVAIEAEALGGVLPTLQELVTKPGLVVGLLKSVVNLLKTRFPAMLGGANLVLSIAVFVVLFVLWYCYKRGREVRLEAEAAAAAANIVGSGEESVIEGSASFPEAAVPSGSKGNRVNACVIDPE